jgi:tetratricopeptide (TPR) repeat protein
VLEYLHCRVFCGGYDLQATAPAAVFATGRYNCVSATIFYNCLAREAGLAVETVRLPQHTRTALVDGEKRLSVEPTCATWFHGGQSSADGEDSLDTDLGDKDPTPQRPISDVALVSMIYYNRGVEALRQHEFQQAIRFNRLALILDPGSFEARGNLLAAINKQALVWAARGQYDDAAELIDAGLTIAPDHRPLVENRALIKRRKRQSTDAAPSVSAKVSKM